MDDLEAAQHLRAEILSAFISQQFKVQDEALAWVEAFWRKKQPSLHPYPISSKLAYCQLPNLCKLVVRAELKPTISNPGGHGCNSDRCATSKYLHKACGITSAPTGSDTRANRCPQSMQGLALWPATDNFSPWVKNVKTWRCCQEP